MAAVTKSCLPQQKEDEDINQEVPQNYIVPVVPSSKTISNITTTVQPHLLDNVSIPISWQPSGSFLPCQTYSPNSFNQNTPGPQQVTLLPTAQATEEHNWQASQARVRDRNAVMFNNPLMSDITFCVGAGSNVKKFPAHKYVLATGSSVFFAMFYGGLANETMEVEIPDVEPVAFQNLLRYLYTDEIFLEADNVLATLYAAKKYIIFHLAKACVNYLETSLSARNACVLLSQGRLFEEDHLMQRCWEVIDAQAEEALRSEGFVDIDHKTLESILSRETLNAREASVFNAVMRWAVAECRRREIDATPENKRMVLGASLYFVRMPAMNLEEFANGPAQSGMLTAQETTDIFLNFTATNKPELKFNCKHRKGLVQFCVHRFQSSAYRSNQWRYRGRCDSIQFSVDKRIFIVGFGLYGSSNGAAEYLVRIELKKNGLLLSQNVTKFKSDGSSSTFPVLFDNPVLIEPDTFYTASAVLDGSELSYFGQEGLAEVQCGKVTVQFQCSSDSTNGTGVQGGQIPELLFFC